MHRLSHTDRTRRLSSDTLCCLTASWVHTWSHSVRLLIWYTILVLLGLLLMVWIKHSMPNLGFNAENRHYKTAGAEYLGWFLFLGIAKALCLELKVAVKVTESRLLTLMSPQLKTALLFCQSLSYIIGWLWSELLWPIRHDNPQIFHHCIRCNGTKCLLGKQILKSLQYCL